MLFNDSKWSSFKETRSFIIYKFLISLQLSNFNILIFLRCNMGDKSVKLHPWKSTLVTLEHNFKLGKNFEEFKKEYKKKFKKNSNQISFLSYDLTGLIYYLLYKNNFEIDKKIFYKKNKFLGKIGVFEIDKNIITHELSFYSVENNKFKKIF